MNPKSKTIAILAVTVSALLAYLFFASLSLPLWPIHAFVGVALGILVWSRPKAP